MFGLKFGGDATRAAVDALVDVAAIDGGVVRLKNGEHAALVEVSGEFFRELGLEDQDDRIAAFGRVLNGLSHPIQLTLFTEPVDISGYVSQMEAARTSSESQALAQLAEEQLRMAEDLAGGVLAEHTVITVTGPTRQDVLARQQQLVSLLRGNEFKAWACGADRVGAILMACYGQPQVPLSGVMGGLNAILRRKIGTQEKTSGEKGPIKVTPGGEDVLGQHAVKLVDVLAPAAVVEHMDRLDLGGVYAATLMAVAYPDQVSNDWLDEILHFQHETVRRRVVMHVAPVRSHQAVAEISRKLEDLEASYRFAQKRGRRADVNTELGLEDAEELRRSLGRGEQKIFDVTMFVTLLADSVEQLRTAVSRLKQEAASRMLVLRETWLEQQPAFRTTMPLGMALVRKIRPIPTLPLATMFPFAAGELLDEHGEFWGQNLLTGNAVILDPDRYSPSHMLVVAKTRSGKSYAIKTIATQVRLGSDSDIIVIDPSPPIDYERWTKLLGGTYARFGVGMRDTVNPCEILLPPDMDRIDEDMLQPVTAKVAWLRSLIEIMAYPEDRMPLEEAALLEGALQAMYAEVGFTDDWESVVDRETLAVTPRARKSPDLRDALRHIAGTAGLETLALKLRPYVEGTLAMFAGQTNVDMSGRLVVFNVHHLVQTQGRHLQAVAYAMVAEFVRWRLAASRRRAFVVVDEAHVMFQREDTARFVSQLYRMAGKLGGRVALLTQGITDLLGDPETGVEVKGEAEARTCLTNTGVVVLLRNDKGSDLQLIQREFNLTGAETHQLRTVLPGQGLVVVGNERGFVQVQATELLHPYLTTNPAELEMYTAQGFFEEPSAPGGRTEDRAASG